MTAAMEDKRSSIASSTPSQTSFFSSVTDFFSSIGTGGTSTSMSILTEAHADEGEGEGGGEEGGEEGGEGGGEEEEEEDEEPEDILPPIQEACKQTPTCKPALHHFEECQERVTSGKGDHGENCAEELFHLMHCVDQCAAPKLFRKLK